MRRILFLGTPEFSLRPLKTLLGDPEFTVAGVITQPDRPKGRHMKLQPSPVKSFCHQEGIEVISPDDVNQEDIYKKIYSWHAESAVVVAFGQILSAAFFALFPRGCVNLHASLLPRWRGAAPIQRSIIAGDHETGMTLQVLVERLDAGPILGQRRCLIDRKDSLELADELAILGQELLLSEYKDYLRGQLHASSQNEEEATYAKKIKKEEGEIKWTLSALQIDRLVRGLAMGPGCWTLRKGRKLKIHRCETADEDSSSQSHAPGSVVAVTKESFLISCGDGSLLRIWNVQPESKSSMSSAEYLRGQPLSLGEQFGIIS